MINLFSKSKGYFLAGVSLSFLIFAGLIHDRKSWGIAIAAFIVGICISWMIASVSAFMIHRQILNILYYQMEPIRFIEVYLPLISASKVRKNVQFTMMCYLSNAYAASGNYDKALETLNNLALNTSRNSLQEVILAGNRCDIFCALEDIAAAKNAFQEAKQASGDNRSQKPVLDLLQVKINLLDKTVSDADVNTVKASVNATSTPFYRITNHFLLAQLYEQLGEQEFAQYYYREVEGGSPQLAISQSAGQRLQKISSR